MVLKGTSCIVLSCLLFAFAGASKKSNDITDSIDYFRSKRQTESTGCILPPHPDHGNWKVLNGEGHPGDKILIASVLTFECKPGYKLSSNIPLVCLGKWSSPVPECQELCPPLYSSNTYDVRCIDKLEKEVNCSEATHGTTLEYTCKTYYETPFGYKTTLFCENSKWDQPKPVCQPACGNKVTNDTKTLIYGSKPNDKIEHPWVTAIFKKFNDSFENVCGGSILSRTVVLTAAHCVTNDYGDALPKEDYRVGVGKLYRRYEAPEDKHAQYFELLKIIVPDGYKGDIRKYAADIAVLVVKTEITLSEVVQPVCFTNMKNIRLHVGNKGEVSGWGLAESNLPSEVLRSLTIPYKYETVCADELPPDWADRYNLRDKICAGFVNQSTSVCSGDSGSGLAFKYRDDNRYYIHGIVSLSHQVGYMCNIQQNALYTSVASYYDFVDRLLTKYAPKINDCILPPYPQNGKWLTEDQNSKPGDAVPSNTILKVKCNAGFKLSSARIVECSTAHNLPYCEMLCPKLKFPNGAYFQCTDSTGQEIDCSTAIDGTYLWYSCPIRYREADGVSNRTCVRGSWGSPTPECIRGCGKKIVDESGEGYDHPWNVAVYKITNNPEEKYKYVCGGSLVSEYVIATASQCVTDESGHLLSKDDYSVGVGKLYLKYDDQRDIHAQFSNITYINIHPGYKGTGKSIYNIALLMASSPFLLNNFVQPICIIESDYAWIDEVSIGMVGWKFTKHVASETVTSVAVADLFRETCEVPDAFNPNMFLTENVCIGFKNESDCLQPEDRGKGIIIRDVENERYYLYAVVKYYEDAKCQEHFWSTYIARYSEIIECTVSQL